MKSLFVLLAFCVVFAAGMALAEEFTMSSPDKRGDHYLTIDVGYETYEIGYWRKMTDSTDGGLNFGVSNSEIGDREYQSYRFSPAIKHYLATDKVVAPYIYAGIVSSYHRYKSDNGSYTGNNEGYSVGALGGVGLEWFPIKNLSIGGHVGAEAAYRNERNSYSSSLSSSRQTEDGYNVNTYSSGIRMNLFF